MSKKSAALLAEALKLSRKERAKLAKELWESLDESPVDINLMSDEEFARELNRRHEEYLRDPSVAIPLEEVKRLTQIR
jgi:putative addiction module component (TIGR02574 family)